MGRKKLTMAEKLQRQAERVQAKQAAETREAQKKREAELDAKAQEYADRLIAELPKKMEKAAKEGKTRIAVLSDYWGHFDDVTTRAMWKVWHWAKAEGLETEHTSHGPCGSDDYTDGSEHFYVIWGKEKPRTPGSLW